MLTIKPLKAFTDNYIWLLMTPNGQEMSVVDPGNGHLVRDFCLTHHLNLKSIVLTHHHWDHTDGVPILKNFSQPEIFGPQKNPTVEGTTRSVDHGDQIHILGYNFEVLSVPGHTPNHLAYYSTDACSSPILFCGDTLFSAGCGRLLGGTADQLYHSLQCISQLPKNTLLYCGHEYTTHNLLFAQQVNPSNQDLQKRIQEVHSLREMNQPSVPSTLDVELKTNPFLRLSDPEVKEHICQHAQRELTQPSELFAALRLWKDHFA